MDSCTAPGYLVDNSNIWEENTQLSPQSPGNIVSWNRWIQLMKPDFNIFVLPYFLGQGNIFTPVCHSVHRGGIGCSRGVCMVVPGGHAWLLMGGVCGCLGACVVALGGMHGCSGEHVWLLSGGMCGCSQRGHTWLLPRGHAWLLGGCVVAARVCVVALGGMHGIRWDTEILNERAVRILLECILVSK